MALSHQYSADKEVGMLLKRLNIEESRHGDQWSRYFLRLNNTYSLGGDFTARVGALVDGGYVATDDDTSMDNVVASAYAHHARLLKKTKM